MKLHALILFIASAAMAQTPRAQKPVPASTADIIDLTPTFVSYEEDGIFTQRLCFNGGRWRVLLALPKGWDAAGRGSLTLTCKEEHRATITLANSPAVVLPLDSEEKLKAIRTAILGLAPADAQDARIAAETPNAIAINGWQTHQFSLTYNHFGVRYHKVVTFIRLNPRQEVQLVTFTPETFSVRTFGAANELLNSWYREPVAQASAAKR